MRLAFRHEFRYGFHVLELRHGVCIQRHAEVLFDKALQSHFFQGVEGEVRLYMAVWAYRYFLLVLNIFLDDAVFLRVRFIDGSVVGGFLRRHLVVEDSLQFEALQLVELGARQVVVVHEDAHYLLVVLHGAVVRLHHFLLEQLLQLCVRFAFRPFFLRHDDGAQHVTVLRDGSFLHLFVVRLEFEFYLVRLHVLSVG